MKQILVDKDSIYYLHTYFNQMLLFFQSSPFFISAGTDCMILHRRYSQRPHKFRPDGTVLKLVGTSNFKAINVLKMDDTREKKMF